MKNYDPGHDPKLHWIAPAERTTADVKQKLIEAHVKATSDPVAELTFVTELLDQLEALYQQDPEADVSLSVKGVWTASIETVVPEVDEEAAA